MKEIKILRIISRLNIGGPAIHVILLSSLMNSFGYKTTLIRGQEGRDEGKMDYLAQKYDILPVYLPELGQKINFFKDLLALIKLFIIIKKEQPDIVHTHTAKAGAIGRIAAWFSGVPVIIHTFHGHVLLEYFSNLKNKIFLIFEKILARLTTQLITLSPKLKDELVGLGVTPSEKISVIPLGFDLKPFIFSNQHRGKFKKILGVPEETRLVGIIGRLVPIKNHDMFLKAAVMVKERFLSNGNNSLVFVIVGDGELRLKLEDKTRLSGLEDIVRFVGFKTDLSIIYPDLDVVVLSSHNEGTPVSLIEAMAVGLPVVATSVGGVPDLIQDNITGLLVPKGEPSALAEAILKLLTNKDLSKSLGKAAQEFVINKFDIQRLVSDLDGLYRNLFFEKKQS